MFMMSLCLFLSTKKNLFGDPLCRQLTTILYHIHSLEERKAIFWSQKKEAKVGKVGLNGFEAIQLFSNGEGGGE